MNLIGFYEPAIRTGKMYFFLFYFTRPVLFSHTEACGCGQSVNNLKRGRTVILGLVADFLSSVHLEYRNSSISCEFERFIINQSRTLCL